MKGKGIFGCDDAERKQLEEISHLYFSTPAERSRPPAASPAVSPRTTKARRGAEPFRVSCLADRRDPSLSTRFLYNLALLLRLTQEEVLFLCSDQAMRDRFSFAFRPDRERSVRVGSGPAATGLVGPLGICLLRRRPDAGEGTSAAKGRGGIPSGGMASFHYVLSDRLAAGPFFVGLPGVTLLLVTPESREDAFQGQGLTERGQDGDEPAHGGIVVAGVRDRDEAGTVYACWKEMLEQRFPGRWRWESYGTCPAPGKRGQSGLAPALDVIQSPTGWQTRCYLETVSLIRKKRRELCGPPPGRRDERAAGDPHPACSGSSQGGCEECAG